MHLFMFFDPKTRAQNPDAAMADARTEIMRQAFCRHDHATVALLEKQGAAFNQEMLYIAAGFPDHDLVKLCLDRGVKPDEELVCRAVDFQDAELVGMMLRYLPPAQNDAARKKMHDYIRDHGSDAVRAAAETVRQRAH